MALNRLLAVFSAFFLTLAYTNCGEMHAVTAITRVSSLCLTKLRAEPLSKMSASLCEESGAYTCVKRVFQPGLTTGLFEEHPCVTINGREHCVPTKVFTYDTESARRSADAAHFEAGGQYNHTEVECTNELIRTANITLVSAESSSVESALSGAITSCRDRSAQ